MNLIGKGTSLALAVTLLTSSQIAFGGSAYAQGGESKTPSEKKFALLIGINDYMPKTAPGDSDRNDLNGCIKDIEDVSTLLQTKYGFKKENVLLIKNTDATREAIDQAFHKHLVANAEKYPDGTFFLQYSGHGASDIPDYDGDDSDNKDECIVPSDLDPIIDDEIGRWTDELTKITKGKGGNVTFVFDCCHSGSISRSVGLTYRRLSVKDLVLDKLKQRETKRGPATVKSVGTKMLPPSDDYVSISACSSAQEEPETAESDVLLRNGVLTRTLTELLESSDDEVSYRELRDRLYSRISKQYGISPQVVGNLDKVFLTGATVKTDTTIPVVSVNGQRVKIRAGAPAGANQEAIIAFYAANDRKQSKVIAQGSVVKSSGTTAVVQIPDSVRADTLKDSKAVIVTPGLGSQPIIVGFDKSIKSTEEADSIKKFQDKLKALLGHKKDDSIDLLEASSEKELYVKKGWDTALVSDTYEKFAAAARFTETSCPKATDIVYFLASSTGQPLYQFYVRPDDPDAVDKVVAALQKRAKQQALIALTNSTKSAINNALEIKASLVTKSRPDPDADGFVIAEETAPLTKTGESSTSLQPGQWYVLEVKNVSGKDIYLNTLIVTNSGRVVPAGSNDPVANGKSTTIGPLQVKLPEGIDAFKFIVTEQPADFSFAKQDAIKRDAGKRLKTGLETALFGGFNRTRDVELPPPAPPPDAWGVDLFEIAVSAKKDSATATQGVSGESKSESSVE